MSALDNLLMERYRESVASVRLRIDAEADLGEALTAVAHRKEANDSTPAPSSDDELNAGDPGESSDETHESTVASIHEALSSLLGHPIDTGAAENIEVVVADDAVSEPTALNEDKTVGPQPDSGLAATETKVELAQESEETSMKSPFKPEWEVDNFLWPAICGAVEEQLKAELTSLLETVQRECQLHLCNVLAIASTTPSSGSTTMTLCLAREAARQGLSVALIDLNHERPMVAHRLGVACEQGIESLPLESVEPQTVCIAAVQDGVSLLPLVQPVDSEYFGSASIQDLLNQVATQHDLVLLDASPEVVRVMLEQNQCRGFGVIWVSPSNDQAMDDQAMDDQEEVILPIESHLSQQRDDFWTVGVIKNRAA